MKIIKLAMDTVYESIRTPKFVRDCIVNKKGGKRANAGRPKKEPTTTISFRVKSTSVEELKKQIKELINKSHS